VPIGALNITGSLLESSVNDGSISTKLSIVLSGSDTFAGSDGVSLAGVTVVNVPSGLTAVVTKLGQTAAELAFTGKANIQSAAASISNLSLTFSNASFTAGDASKITGSSRSDLAITFLAGAGTSTAPGSAASPENDFINGNQGTVSAPPLTFNAAEGSDQFFFNLDVANNTANVVINGFSANDKLIFTSEAAASLSTLGSIYSISDNLTDITLVSNRGGSVQQIKLAGLTHATTINSFDALATLLGSGTIVVNAASQPGAGTLISPAANETLGNDVINANQRSVMSAAKEFNAANGNDKYVLNTNVTENAAYIRISNFAAGDQLVFVSTTGTTNLSSVNTVYAVSDNTQDVTLTANVNGSVQSVTLVGLAGSRASVGGAIDSVTELASFIGADALVFA
jgi:hypothetical protein